MARLARLVIPGLPHHITQRGNRRQQTFFNDDDYAAYVDLMAEWCREEGVEIWSYCLMPNHVHLIAVPKTEEGCPGPTTVDNHTEQPPNPTRR
jgi:putative transposase